jgi:phosphotransferase system IIA component
MKGSKKIWIVLGALVGILFIGRKKVNAHGLTISKGKAFKAAPYFFLYYTDAPHAVFASTGSNANFLVHGITTVMIEGQKKSVAVVTYLESQIEVGAYLIDIDAFIKPITP